MSTLRMRFPEAMRLEHDNSAAPHVRPAQTITNGGNRKPLVAPEEAAESVTAAQRG
jgi:hypothetical protein